MPSCGVPSCRTGYSSYKGPKYCTVNLPKSEKWRNIWLKKMSKTVYTDSVIICLKHFSEDNFVPENENVDSKGRRRVRKKLKPDAVPNLYLTDNCSEPKPKRGRPNRKLDSDLDNMSRKSQNDFEPEMSELKNPWNVTDASVFLKYCCPECDYTEQNLRIFSEHPLENHDLANTLFKKTRNKDFQEEEYVKFEVPDEHMTEDLIDNDNKELIPESMKIDPNDSSMIDDSLSFDVKEETTEDHSEEAFENWNTE